MGNGINKCYFGGHEDYKDERDFKLEGAASAGAAEDGLIYDLTNKLPAIRDQGKTHCSPCVAVAFVLEYEYMKLNEKFKPNFNFLYNQLQKTKTKCTTRNVLKILNRTGVCSEESETDIKKGILYKSVNYNQITSCLNKNNLVIFTYPIYDNFLQKSLTSLDVASTAGKKEIAYHTGVICGYDSVTKCFKVANSWGTQWGKNGFLYVDENYVKEKGSSYWTVARAVPVRKEQAFVYYSDSDSSGADVDDIC